MKRPSANLPLSPLLAGAIPGKTLVAAPPFPQNCGACTLNLL